MNMLRKFSNTNGGICALVSMYICQDTLCTMPMPEHIMFVNVLCI